MNPRRDCTWPRRRFLLGGASLLIGAGARLRADEAPADNPVLLWNEAFIAWVKAQSPPPALTARNLAILHLALWRTAAHATAHRLPAASLAAAMHASGREICLALFPSHGGEIEALHDRAMKAVAATAQDPDPVALARHISRSILEARAGDGSSTTVHYVPRDAPGQWRRTPAALRPPELPHWGTVKPFLMESPRQFRPPPPPDITGAAFADELREVGELGARESATRTARETESAHFWSDFSYTTSPPGHWNDIARVLAANRLGIPETARLFALLNTALADAGIAAWDCKYHYNFWRPVTALRAGPERGWESLLPSPPHPEYVSGHSAFSGAAATVLEAVFGTSDLSFAVMSDTVKSVTRTYGNLHEAAAEISRSRVLGGIHFTTSCNEGLVLGRKVAAWCLRAFDKTRVGDVSSNR